MNTHSGQQSNPTLWTLYAGFASIIAFIVVIAWVAHDRNVDISDRLELVVGTYNVRMEMVQEMRLWARERSTILHAAANHDDAFEREALLQGFLQLGTRFISTRAELVKQSLDKNERLLLAQHREAARTVAPLQREAMDLIGDERIDEARLLLATRIHPLQAKALEALDNFVSYEYERGQAARAQMASSVDKARDIIRGLAAAGILLSIIIAAMVINNLNRLLRGLKQARDNLEDRVQARTAELQEAHDDLERLAHYDSLTQLPNRRLFYNSLNAFLSRAKRFNSLAALLFIDLDGFKAVNDTHGHDSGDELLRQVAQRLTKIVRESDMVARLGGDEFTIILGDLHDIHDADAVAVKIIEAIQREFDVLGASVRIGSSIGVAVYPLHAEDRDTLLKVADDLMYEVKKTGKNHYLMCKTPQVQGQR